MNTVQLECYMAVAENLNFARAAEQLHITQPAVTHQINSLETELDVKLFKRTTRTVELTSRDGFFSDTPGISWQRQPRPKTDLPDILKIRYSLLS